MNGKYFFDTNILVYSFDDNNKQKQTIANDLIYQAIRQNNGCISFQVIQEFLNVSLTKFKVKFKRNDYEKYFNKVLEPLCEIHSSFMLYKDALLIKDRWKYSFYDSLIIAAALKANCTILYSEDLQHGQIIDDLKIVNPFLTNSK